MKQTPYTECIQDGNDIIYLMEDGTEIKTTVSELESYIEENSLNVESQYYDNNSPKNDGDPRYDLERDVETSTPSEYLEDNFDQTVLLWFNEKSKTN